MFLDILPSPDNHSNMKATLDQDAVAKRGMSFSERGKKPFGFHKALSLMRRAPERKEQRLRLFEKADAQAKRIVALAIEKYNPRRIYCGVHYCDRNSLMKIPKILPICECHWLKDCR